MKNSNMPAMPFADESKGKEHLGLTKREHAAIIIYAGMLRHTSFTDSQLQCAAERSVFAADALLSELEKTTC